MKTELVQHINTLKFTPYGSAEVVKSFFMEYADNDRFLSGDKAKQLVDFLNQHDLPCELGSSGKSHVKLIKFKVRYNLSTSLLDDIKRCIEKNMKEEDPLTIAVPFPDFNPNQMRDLRQIPQSLPPAVAKPTWDDIPNLLKKMLKIKPVCLKEDKSTIFTYYFQSYAGHHSQKQIHLTNDEARMLELFFNARGMTCELVSSKGGDIYPDGGEPLVVQRIKFENTSSSDTFHDELIHKLEHMDFQAPPVSTSSMLTNTFQLGSANKSNSASVSIDKVRPLIAKLFTQTFKEEFSGVGFYYKESISSDDKQALNNFFNGRNLTCSIRTQKEDKDCSYILFDDYNKISDHPVLVDEILRMLLDPSYHAKPRPQLEEKVKL